MNRFLQKMRLVLNFLESLIRYGLDFVSMSLLRAIIVFFLVPIVTFTIVYWLSGTVEFNDGSPLPIDMKGFLYSLYFSIATFTGMELVRIVPRCAGLWISALEAIVAYVNTVIGIGIIVSARLSPE